MSGGYFLRSYQAGWSSLSRISVSIGPGFTSATWMFEPARSFHRPSLKAFMAVLQAAHIASRGRAPLAAEEVALVFRLGLRGGLRGVAAHVVRTLESQINGITGLVSIAGIGQNGF